jgi:hypothetical protein
MDVLFTLQTLFCRLKSLLCHLDQLRRGVQMAKDAKVFPQSFNLMLGG